MRSMYRKHLVVTIGRLICVLLAFASWELVSLSGVFNSLLFPAPLAVMLKLYELTIGMEIVGDIASTLGKVIIAVAIGSFLGIFVGVILARDKLVYEAVSPFLDFFRSIPATALFPLFLLVFGIGDATNTSLAIWICTLYLSLHVSKGLVSTSETALMIAKSLRLSEVDTLIKVRFMEALPMIFVGFRTSVSLSVVVVIVCEMFVGTVHGLGKALVDAAYVYDIPKLYATIIIVGIIGYCLNLLVLAIERKAVHWEKRD